MRGDILVIEELHRQAAKDVVEIILKDINAREEKYLVNVAGESGAGKSELAYAIKGILDKLNIPAYIIQQDDYFVYPPKTNARMRVSDINRVGPQEVRLQLLNDNIQSLLSGQARLTKPLVIFDDDLITAETIDLEAYRVIIIDGTYTTLLDKIDCRIFINRDKDDTRDHRLKRNREKQDDFLEKILEIEHQIISKHKKLADIVVSKEFKVSRP